MKETILKIVCRYCDIDKGAFFGDSRISECVRARIIFYNLVSELTDCSDIEILAFMEKSNNRGFYPNAHQVRMLTRLNYKKSYNALKQMAEKRRFKEFESKIN